MFATVAAAGTQETDPAIYRKRNWIRWHFKRMSIVGFGAKEKIRLSYYSNNRKRISLKTTHKYA